MVSENFCGFGDQNYPRFRDQGSKLWMKYGISYEKIYLVTTLRMAALVYNEFHKHLTAETHIWRNCRVLDAESLKVLLFFVLLVTTTELFFSCLETLRYKYRILNSCYKFQHSSKSLLQLETKKFQETILCSKVTIYLHKNSHSTEFNFAFNFGII